MGSKLRNAGVRPERNGGVSSLGIRSPLAFGDDFLSSVWVDVNEDGINDNAATGMLVYNQIAQDVNSAYVSDAMKFFGTALSLAGNGIKGFKVDIPLPKIGDTLKGVPVGAFVAAGAAFAAKQLNPPAPNITYLEAEAAIVGTINDVANSGSLSSIELHSPGSFIANHSLVPWTQHTFYNELPGLFALLKTPNIQFAHDWGGANSSALGGFGVALEDPLEYVLNPAAEIDLDNTEIYAAIEFDVYSPFVEPYHVLYPQIYGDSYDGSSDLIIANFIGAREDLSYTNYDTPESYDAAQSMADILKPSFDLAWTEFVDNKECKC